MPIIQEFHHRREIDGLRAIAVLAVVFCHAGISCTGGYIGVDVFFVISGYLITSLIWKDLESSRFTFAGFWERRIRRIVPAMVVVTIAVQIAGWYLMTPADLKTLGNATKSQALFVANVHYWRDTGYFLGTANEKPLLHTWSLAVEEQFYLVVPLLLWGIYRSMKLRSRTAVISVLMTGFLISLAVSIYSVPRAAMAAFYLLPSRAWELLFGSLLAFLPVSSGALSKRGFREFVSALGMAMIVVPIFLYTRDTPFPGLAAVPPCLGAALLIWSNGPGRTGVGALLSLRPIVFIGLISYSLYLWHWPFLAYSRYSAFEPLSAGYRAAMIGAGFVMAVLSWKFVETPFRTRKLGSTRKSMFAYGGTSLTAVLGCGAIFALMQGFPKRFSPEALEFANAAGDKGYINQLTAEDVKSGKLVPFGAANPALKPSVLVWGDSHAMSALPAFDSFLKEKGLSGRAATHSSTPPVLDWYIPLEWGLKEESIPFNEAVLTYIKNEKIPDVVLIANWGGYFGDDKNNPASFSNSLLATVRRIATAGAQPWVMLDVPSQPFNVPTALSRAIYPASKMHLESLCSRPAAHDELETYDSKLTAEIKEAGGRILDPKPRFISPTGYYMIEANGIALYQDQNHLTAKGANLMLLPLLREAMTLEATQAESRRQVKNAD